MKFRVLDPEITAEIANSTAENVTMSSSSSGSPPPNNVPNSTDASISEDGNNGDYAEGGIVLHLEPLQEIIIEEGEENREDASEITTPCNLPSSSNQEQGARSSILIGQRLTRSMHTRIYSDAVLQHLTRVLFTTDEPNTDNLLNDVQNAFVSINLEDENENPNHTDNSTDSPAGHQNQMD